MINRSEPHAGTPKTLEDFCRFKKISLTPFHIAYSAHVKSYGWLNYVRDGQTAGTTGESRRLEAVKIRLEECTKLTVSVLKTMTLPLSLTLTWCFAKSIAGGFPLAGVTGRAEVMDAVAPGGLGGT